MAGTPGSTPTVDASGERALIVEARYHDAINDMLLAGARDVLTASGVQIDHRTVLGALEIPIAIALAADSGRYGLFVALGCVIRGETTHYELVSRESCRGLIELATRERLSLGNGILTVENERQAVERADPARQDKGGFAAHAALALYAMRRDLR